MQIYFQMSYMIGIDMKLLEKQDSKESMTAQNNFTFFIKLFTNFVTQLINKFRINYNFT